MTASYVVLLLLVVVAREVRSQSISSCFAARDCQGTPFTSETTYSRCCLQPPGGLSYAGANQQCHNCEDQVVEFARGNHTVGEASSFISLEIVRFGDTTNEALLIVVLQQLTAIAGDDFGLFRLPTVELITLFSSNQSVLQFGVQIMDDSFVEDTESFIAQLRLPSDAGTNPPELQIGLNTTTVSILDNDFVNISIAPTNVSLVEQLQQLTFQLFKEGTAVRDVQVVVSTQPNSARAPGDFVFLSRTLTFSPLDSELTVAVTVQDDAVVEGEEEFFVVVAAAPGERGVMIPQNSAVVVSITDNDTLAIGFDTANYTVRELEGNVSVQVVKVGENERPVSVLFSTLNGTATDDFTSTTDRVLTFRPGDTVLSVPVSILQEGLLEETENFRCVLTPVRGETGVVISRDMTSVNIVDSDEVRIGFEDATVSVRESTTVDVVVSLQGGMLGRTATVEVMSVDGLATALDDFQLITMTTLTFSAAVLRQNVTVHIREDSLYEGRENFSLVISTSDSGIVPSPDQVTILITDIDVVTVTFDRAVYEVEEDERVLSVTLTLVGQLQRSLQVTMVTQDGSAIGGSDYEVINRVLTFDPVRTTQTVSVAILDDDVSDGIKEFFLQVLPLNTQLPSPLAESTVRIFDNENVTVEFIQSSYTANEGDGVVLLEISKNGLSQQDVVVDVVLQDLTARGGLDYGPFPSSEITLTFVLLGNSTAMQFGVAIREDSVVEEAENFSVRVELQEGGTPGVLIGRRREAVVVIEDNDVMNITLHPDSITLTEDNATVEFTVSRDMDTILNRTIRIDVTFVGDTASPGRDFVFGAFSLSFLPTATAPTSLPVSIMILEDEVVEATEELVVVLSVPQGEGGVALLQNNSTVVILDEDVVQVAFTRPSYTVVEGEGVVSVAVEVVGRGEREVTVTVELLTADIVDSARATLDYNDTFQLIEFTPEEGQQIVTIAILDDDLRENVEQFSVQLRVPPGERGVALGSLSSAEVVIMDDDNVLVDFNPSTYVVREREEEVVLMVRRLGGSITNVTVEASTQNGTATAPSDYTAVREVLVFPPSLSNQILPLRIPISNDLVYEGGPEMFSVRLEIPSEEKGVSAGLQHTAIVTIEEDALQVGFEREEYTVMEEEGVVEVCVGRVGRSEVSVRFLVATQELSMDQPQRATSPLDFRAVTTALVLPPTEERVCLNITIRDDGVDEREERFSVVIQSVPAGVIASRQRTTVTILSRVPTTSPEPAVVSFERAVYSVNEGDRTTEVCVTVTGGPRMENISVRVETTPVPCVDFAIRIYVCTSQVLTFSPNMNRSCVTIPLRDNTIIADREQRIGVIFTLLTANAMVAQSMTTTIVADDEGLLGNDTVIGDPLFAVPLFVTNGSQLLPERRLPHLCYEIHGRDRWYLNLISDTCVSVNAHYTAINRTIDTNVISTVGIKAVNSNGLCVNIEVGVQNGCVPVITEAENSSVAMNRYRSGRISVRKHRERVRISLPNCENVQLVMWITCQNLQRIHFVVTRGINLRPTSHGLLGQFWNIPVTVEQFSTGSQNPYFLEEELYAITLHPARATQRTFVAELYDQTWDYSREICFYAGSIQGGPVREIAEPNDPVIQGSYRDYSVASLFETDFVYSRFNVSLCV